MAGRIDHMIVTVNSYDKACGFYTWLMPKLGYPNMHDYGVTRGGIQSAAS
jgi:hypothetical protein